MGKKLYEKKKKKVCNWFFSQYFIEYIPYNLTYAVQYCYVGLLHDSFFIELLDLLSNSLIHESYQEEKEEKEGRENRHFTYLLNRLVQMTAKVQKKQKKKRKHFKNE